MKKMKWSVFYKWLLVALKSDTTYALGAFGFPLNAANKKRLLNNKNNAKFEKAINAGKVTTFAFDCICLIKAILWGWVADTKKNYGGAVYKANGVPDVNADQMMTSTHMTNLSTDFSKIKVGAFVGMKGHIGVYVGNGNVIECTPKWTSNVLMSKLKDRKWINWGMCKYIDYSELDPVEPPKPKPDPKPTPNSKATIKVGAKYVSKAAQYNGKPVNTKYIGTPLDYVLNQVADKPSWVYFPIMNSFVDKKDIIFGDTPKRKTNEELAEEVKIGKWGNGADRKKRLTDAGYDYDAIQKIVNESSKKPTPIKKGDVVEVINPIQYTGGRFITYYKRYDVLDVSGDRIVIGKGKTITAAVNVINLKKVN